MITFPAAWNWFVEGEEKWKLVVSFAVRNSSDQCTSHASTSRYTIVSFPKTILWWQYFLFLLMTISMSQKCIVFVLKINVSRNYVTPATILIIIGHLKSTRTRKPLFNDLQIYGIPLVHFPKTQHPNFAHFIQHGNQHLNI